MNTKAKILPEHPFKYQGIMVHNGVHLHPQADFAMKLMIHFGSVAGTPNGEDSTGRSKLRLQTPEELVARCCSIAELSFKEWERRDWLLEVPDPELRKEHEKKSE